MLSSWEKSKIHNLSLKPLKQITATPSDYLLILSGNILDQVKTFGFDYPGISIYVNL